MEPEAVNPIYLVDNDTRTLCNLVESMLQQHIYKLERLARVKLNIEDEQDDWGNRARGGAAIPEWLEQTLFELHRNKNLIILNIIIQQPWANDVREFLNLQIVVPEVREEEVNNLL